MAQKTDFLNLGENGKRILKELEKDAGKMTRTERIFYTALARTLEIAATADDDMIEKGMIQTFENGARQVSPEWAVFRNALNDARAMALSMPKIKEAIAGVEDEKVIPTLETFLPKRRIG